MPQLSKWVLISLLSKKYSENTALVLHHFVEILDELHKLQNYNAIFSIIGSLDRASRYFPEAFQVIFLALFYLHSHLLLVHHFKKEMNTGDKSIFENMKRIADSKQSWRNYRSLLYSTDPPMVPFLGVYLTDLLFIWEGGGSVIYFFFGFFVSFFSFFFFFVTTANCKWNGQLQTMHTDSRSAS
jgi:hypothetical protein